MADKIEPSVKGISLNLTREYLIKTYGKEAFDKMLEHMEPRDKQILSGLILVANWYPEKTNVCLLETAERVLAKGDRALYQQVGYYHATTSIPNIYKMFIRFGSPVFMIKKAPMIYRLLHNTGRLEIHSVSQKSVTGRLYDHPLRSRALCGVVAGFTKGALEMSGAKNVACQMTKCLVDADEFCEAVLTWT